MQVSVMCLKNFNQGKISDILKILNQLLIKSIKHYTGKQTEILKNSTQRENELGHSRIAREGFLLNGDEVVGKKNLPM